MSLARNLLLLATSFIFFYSCKEDDTAPLGLEEDGLEDTESVPYFLVEATQGGGVFLIDENGNEVFNWNLDEFIGNDADLLDDGSLVTTLRSDASDITFGGYGGTFRKINADQTTAWETSYSSSEYNAHHDVEITPDGNIIFLVWEKVEALDAEVLGFEGGFDIYPEAIIEMNPLTEEVVWEWHMTDHLVQDHDDTKSNYGVVADNPNKININYNSSQTDGDITHANGLTYDEENDLLYMTVNFYSEVWVIDHSTTTAEAATGSGGNFGHGGDLIYRWGNPETYDNTAGETVLNRVHYPNLLDSGNVLVYANQVDQGQSEAIEFELPTSLELIPGADNEPEIVWGFTHADLYSNIVSSAVRMDNGNTLITEGTEGTLWEVTSTGEVVSQQEVSDTSVWRTYVFYSDDSAIEALGIE